MGFNGVIYTFSYYTIETHFSASNLLMYEITTACTKPRNDEEKQNVERWNQKHPIPLSPDSIIFLGHSCASVTLLCLYVMIRGQYFVVCNFFCNFMALAPWALKQFSYQVTRATTPSISTPTRANTMARCGYSILYNIGITNLNLYNYEKSINFVLWISCA